MKLHSLSNTCLLNHYSSFIIYMQRDPFKQSCNFFLFGLSYLKWYCVVWEGRKNACTVRVRAQHGALQFGSKWAIKNKKKNTNAQASHRKPNTARFWIWFVSLSALWVGFVEHVCNFVHWPNCMNCIYIKSATFYTRHSGGCLLWHFFLSCYVKCW